MRTRAELLSHVHNTHSQDNRPEIGKQLACTANRAGVAERFEEAAVQTTIAVDLGLITYDDERLKDLELSIVKTAKPHDAGEVAGGGDRVVLLGATARHHGVEDGGRRRVARQEGEEVRPVDLLDGGPAGLDAVEQVVRGPRVPLLAYQQDVVADGVRGVAPQR